MMRCVGISKLEEHFLAANRTMYKACYLMDGMDWRVSESNSPKVIDIVVHLAKKRLMDRKGVAISLDMGVRTKTARGDSFSLYIVCFAAKVSWKAPELLEDGKVPEGRSGSLRCAGRMIQWALR